MRVGLGLSHAAAQDALEAAILTAVTEALRGASGLWQGSQVGTLAHDGEGAERAEAALRDAVLRIERHNYQVVSLDITVSAPELSATEMEEMRHALARFAHVGSANVVVKSVPGTGMLLAGGKEAVAIAITLLDQIADLDMLHASIRSGG